MEESMTTALRVIGDIGGTYARFAVAERGKYSELQHLSVSKYATLKDALGEYLDALPRDMHPTRGALAVAGPVSGDEVKLTNLN
jgi:glucokinase